MNRYTAEFRGGDNDDDPSEWCVVDEYLGPVGSAVLFNMSEFEAVSIAAIMNKPDESKE